MMVRWRPGNARDRAWGRRSLRRSPDRPVDATPRASRLPLADTVRVQEDALRAAAFVEVFVNPVRGQILMFAAQHPGLTISDLASLTGVSLSTASLYVTQLRASHWLTVDVLGREKRVRVALEHRQKSITVLRQMATRFASEG